MDKQNRNVAVPSPRRLQERLVAAHTPQTERQTETTPAESWMERPTRTNTSGRQTQRDISTDACTGTPRFEVPTFTYKHATRSYSETRVHTAEAPPMRLDI